MSEIGFYVATSVMSGILAGIFWDARGGYFYFGFSLGAVFGPLGLAISLFYTPRRRSGSWRSIRRDLTERMGSTRGG